MKHPLKAWLKDRGITQKDFAAAVGVSETALSRLVKGHAWPSPATAARIYELTDGMITAGDLVDASAEQESRG